MKRIFKDVNIEKIEFLSYRHDVKIEFSDLYNGSNLENLMCGNITCRNIFSFNLIDAFEPEDDSFPCFVPEVEYEELIGDSILEKFKECNYSFRKNDGEIAIPKSDKYFFLKIECGILHLEVLCQSLEISKNS